MHPGKGDLDHPITYASRKLSFAERNYTTTEREGLAMVYALQKFKHYLLGGHFKMFTDHFALQYLVNKPVLGGRICRWFLLFQEFDFEIVVKPGWLNAGPDHLSHVVNGGEPANIDDGGLAMVYALQKFRHYLLGGHFKMFTDHSSLQYLVNNPVLGGRICR